MWILSGLVGTFCALVVLLCAGILFSSGVASWKKLLKKKT